MRGLVVGDGVPEVEHPALQRGELALQRLDLFLVIEDGLGELGVLALEMGVADLEIDEAAFHGREPYQIEWSGPISPPAALMTTFERMTEGSFEGVEGIKIFTREWQPAGKPHAVVVISHGFNSHSGHYAWVAEQFAAKGLAVYALDHRGRGRSDGERFFVENFADYTTDLAAFIDMVKVREPACRCSCSVTAPAA